MITTTIRLGRVLRRSALPAVAIGVLTLAGCGSSNDSSSAAAGDSSGSAGTTVTIRDASGTQVLATPTGQTLYVSDQEKHQVLCASSACQAVWTPLTVPSGDKPTAPQELAGEVSTLKRPDGSSQVALNGQPLYTFALDRGAGQINGDGQADSFDGSDFTWHVATPAGHAPAAPSPSTSPDGDGGYNY